MRFTVFTHSRDNLPSEVESDWAEFVEFLREQATVERHPQDKGQTPAISPALYPDDTTRANANVSMLASWLAMDVDHNGVTVDDLIEYLESIPLDYVIHTTSSHKPGSECFRVIVPLDGEVHPSDASDLWAGAFEFFGGITDVQTKDPARIFYVPAEWIGTRPRFHARTKGDVLSVGKLLSLAPPPPPPPPPIPVSKVEMARIRRALAGKGKGLTPSDSLLTSPVVSATAIDRYLGLPKGQHHGGLYQFMAAIAARSIFLGYSITAADIANYSRQLNAMSFVKTAANRRFDEEATRALRWAINNVSSKEFSENAKQ
jgi:hypothetical protein